MPFDHTVLPVHCDTGEVAYPLVQSCKLVEEGSLAAVLVAHQSECKLCPFRQGVACSFGMEPTLLAKTWVGCYCVGFDIVSLISWFFFRLCRVIRGNHNMLGLRKAQGQLITIYLYLDRIPHGGELYNSY